MSYYGIEDLLKAMGKIDTSVMTRKERIVFYMWRTHGFNQPVIVDQIVPVIYGYGMSKYGYKGYYGAIYKVLQHLVHITHIVRHDRKSNAEGPDEYVLLYNDKANKFIKYRYMKYMDLDVPLELIR